MFDFSFGELALCFIVALVVPGPEKLPKVARPVGRWAGQARGYMRNLSAELERETQVMDIKRQLLEAKAALQDAEVSAKHGRLSILDGASKDLNPRS